MPYGKFPEDGKVAVYKVGPDKKKVGKRLGLHPDDKAAQRQIAALMANENKPKKELDLIEDEAVTEETTKDYYGDPVPVVMVDGMDHGPLSFADLAAEQAAREAQYEMYELTDQFGRLSRNIMNSDTDDKAGALVALANEYAALVGTRIQEEMTEDKAATLIKQIAGDNQPVKQQDNPGGDSGNQPDTQSLYIWKEGDIYRWLAAYSNNRRDSDNPPEIISTESHKEFDEALHKGEWDMPEAWLWHVPYAVGITDYHAFDESTGFPVAAGHFYPGMEWAAEGIVKAGWDKNSHGMPNEWIKRDEADPTIIIRHRTKEITFLPLWAAANKLAFSIIHKESSMSEVEKGLPAHKRDEFVKAFGEDKVQQIEATLADKAKEADEAGIEKKEATQALTVKDLASFTDAIKEMFVAVDTRLKALETKPVVEEKEEESYDLVALLKSMSVVGKPEAKVDGRTAEAKDGPKETKPEPQLGAGFAEQFVNVNQAWYDQRGVVR
jgi:hypothetical protein